jgi:hypothetical protein
LIVFRLARLTDAIIVALGAVRRDDNSNDAIAPPLRAGAESRQLTCPMEITMSSNPMRCTLVGGAVVALAAITSSSAMAGDAPNAMADAAPIVVAQTAMPVAMLNPNTALDEHPAYQRGVRKAAAEGPEALRRYIWRTRMIHNFYYKDFARQE